MYILCTSICRAVEAYLIEVYPIEVYDIGKSTMEETGLPHTWLCSVEEATWYNRDP